MAALVSVRKGFAELSHFTVDPDSVRLLPRIFCRRHAIVVLGRVPPRGTEPALLGAVYPELNEPLAEAAQLLGRPVEVVRLNLYEVDRALSVGFDPGEGRRRPDPERTVPLRLPLPDADAPVATLVDALLADAVRSGASDIHIETYTHDVDVRLRIDGILHQQYTHASPDNAAELVSRIKVLSELDIAERRRPQDGRFRAVFQDGARFLPVDFRVSVVPSPGGEDVVIRVLDASLGLRSVRELGMAAAEEETFLRLLANPEGLLLVTGPTSSGKTTTLYSALSHISDQHRKIMTAEDPIEYYIDRINQKQVSPFMSLPELLRALLRQNPDVMLFGEIRDLESGSVALEAAATGHLVLGTLHTSDALGVVMRMRGIGLENNEIASSLLGAVGQRLVRRICAGCAAPYEPTESERRLFGILLDGRSFQQGRGCERCRGTGYKGRIGIYELLVVGEELQDLIGDGAPGHDLRRWTAEHGFRNMTLDALDKAAVGVTTLAEVVRVLPYRQITTTRQDQERRRA